jgi:RNA polymerase sigma factor (TIGR02999 family)
MESGQASDLLEKVNAGDAQAFESLVSLAYIELREMAGSFMRGQCSGHTLQPTALVNEAYLRLVKGRVHWDNKAHFFGAAASAMRQVLVAHARQRSAQKRPPGAAKVTFSDLKVQSVEPHTDVQRLDDALTALGRVDLRLARNGTPVFRRMQSLRNRRADGALACYREARLDLRTRVALRLHEQRNAARLTVRNDGLNSSAGAGNFS